MKRLSPNLLPGDLGGFKTTCGPRQNGVSFQGFQDEGVVAVDDGGVEGGEVDLGGGFGVVAHAFADYADGDALGFGC